MNYDPDRTPEDYGEPQETEGIPVEATGDVEVELGNVIVDMRTLRVVEGAQCEECNDEGEYEMMTLGWNGEPIYWTVKCEGYAHEMTVQVTRFDENGLRGVAVDGI